VGAIPGGNLSRALVMDFPLFKLSEIRGKSNTPKFDERKKLKTSLNNEKATYVKGGSRRLRKKVVKL